MKAKQIEKIWNDLVEDDSNSSIRKSKFTFNVWDKVPGKERVYINMIGEFGGKSTIAYVDLNTKKVVEQEFDSAINRYGYLEKLEKEIDN